MATTRRSMTFVGRIIQIRKDKVPVRLSIA